MLDEQTIEAVIGAAGPNCEGAGTAVPRLEIWSATRPTGSEPALFEPKIYLVLQGVKRMRIAGGTYDLGPGDCAVSILGLPFRYEVRKASPERPYVGVGLKLDPATIAALLLDWPTAMSGIGSGGPSCDGSSFATGVADPQIFESMERLLRLSLAPDDVPILGPLAERELLYRLLQSRLGGPVRRIAEGRGNIATIRRAAEEIRLHAAEPMRVAEIADGVGMSQTSFHRHFKAVTGLTPLAYQRHIRLLDAQRRLASGTPVTSVAFEVGYQSPSQFSREYRQMFKVPPIEHRRAAST